LEIFDLGGHNLGTVLRIISFSEDWNQPVKKPQVRGGGLKFRSQPYNYALTTKPASVIWIAIGSDLLTPQYGGQQLMPAHNSQFMIHLLRKSNILSVQGGIK